MTFTVRWPDGRVEELYSPSLVVHDHLRAGTTYTVGDFVARSTTALEVASDRVRAKFGFACTSAQATVEQVHRSAEGHPTGALVEVLRLHPPLPRGGAS